MSPVRSVAVALVLVGCKAVEPMDGESGFSSSPVPITSATHGPSLGAPQRLLVRAVDSRGLASGPASARARVGQDWVDVEVDEFGYGFVDLTGPGAYPLSGIGSDVAIAEPWVLATGWTTAYAGKGVADHVEMGASGALVAAGNAVWWVGDSLPEHPVALFTEPGVRGLRAVDVDAEGGPDAVAWSGERVVVLLGRPSGGAKGSFVIEAPGWAATGSDVLDLDEDGVADLAVAWQTPDGGVVQIWGGIGDGTFEKRFERVLGGLPVDLVAARDRSDGRAVVTVLAASGRWERLLRADSGEWRLTGPPFEAGAGPDTRVRSGGDFSGNGRDNLLVIGPRVPGMIRELSLWSLDTDSPSFLRLEWWDAHVTVADINGSGILNVIGLERESRALSYLEWNSGQPTLRDAGVLSGVGEIGFGSFDDDASLDLLVGGETWSWFRGSNDGSGARWRPLAPLADVASLSLAGPVFASQEGVVAAIDRVGGNHRLVRLGFGPAGPTIQTPTPLAPPSATFIDAVACGDRAWVISTEEVISAQIGGAVIGRSAVSGASAVACVEDDEGHRAVVSTSSERIVFDAAVVETERESASGGYAAWIGGEVVTCSEPCLAAMDDSGDPVVYSAGAEGVRVARGDQTWALPGGHAEMSLQDVDGDGVSEILWRFDDRFVGIAGWVDGRLTPPRVFHVPSNVSGAPVAAVRGGRVELWLRRDQALVGPP